MLTVDNNPTAAILSNGYSKVSIGASTIVNLPPSSTLLETSYPVPIASDSGSRYLEQGTRILGLEPDGRQRGPTQRYRPLPAPSYLLDGSGADLLDSNGGKFMSPQITRRALSTGLGIGAFGLFPKPASADTPFSSYPFLATGATTARTMPDRLADIVSVKEYGARGNGNTDDTTAIQAAIDAAFGPANAPHGNNSTLNRPLFFPNGNYIISSPLVFTQVLGGHIYGSGNGTTNIFNASGTSGAVTVNGMRDTYFEHLGFGSTLYTSGVTNLELDDQTGFGLQNNTFSNVNFTGGAYALRIGYSGNGGAFNRFYDCAWANSNIAGMVTWSPSAVGNCVFGGGANTNNGLAFWIRNGQIAGINDVGLSGNGNNNGYNAGPDIQIDATCTCLIKGMRTETFLFLVINNTGAVVTLDGCSGSSFAQQEVCRAAGTVGGAQANVIMDSCFWNATPSILSTNASYAGKFYCRGNIYPAAFFTGFTGTLAQSI
jgi:hypothetical protein